MSRRDRRPSRPTTLPVGGVEFRVDWDAKMAKDTHGETRVATCEIDVNSSLCEDVAHETRTLLHESIHAALGTAGLDTILDAYADKNGFALEESICQALENNLYPTICALVKRGYFR
jgi:hypothetical protein